MIFQTQSFLGLLIAAGASVGDGVNARAKPVDVPEVCVRILQQTRFLCFGVFAGTLAWSVENELGSKR